MKQSITALAALLAVLCSCSSDDTSSPLVIGPECTNIEITSHIVSPTVWETGNVYIVRQDLDVTSQLTIEPGAIIKVSGAQIETVGQGRIIANGTAANPIIFTSLKDDSACGDSNHDGVSTQPGKGDWTGIYLNGGQNHLFSHCKITYAGKDRGGWHNAVVISENGKSFHFDRCTFAYTATGTSASDFAFYGSYHMADPAVSKFTNNVFFGNDRPLYVDSNYTLDVTNQFHNPANAFEKNKRNGIWLMDTARNDHQTTFAITEVPYVFTSFNQGGLHNSLSISANVVVKFDGATSGLLTQLTRPVVIHATATLTSFKDDQHGGDTNGDADATVAQNGDWDGFFDSDANQYVNASNIRYADN
ncbi:hypothetical protein [Flavobacterium selenitireducens]|uniref:hypothetical protein n=1 Tax=Flavobacterium selenitireducens TaxID=2722704 RepID=UPI00168BE2EE|nr:hypothetical protein [Flavobacterium selenitireducens]MBD3583568.1 hypothetical protein [Flavobacterium selenitireducens]